MKIKVWLMWNSWAIGFQWRKWNKGMEIDFFLGPLTITFDFIRR